MRVILTEEYDDHGNLTKIIANEAYTGDHVLDAHWDPHDEQTPEKRAEFRTWVNTMLIRKGHDPIN